MDRVSESYRLSRIQTHWLYPLFLTWDWTVNRDKVEQTRNIDQHKQDSRLLMVALGLTNMQAFLKDILKREENPMEKEIKTAWQSHKCGFSSKSKAIAMHLAQFLSFLVLSKAGQVLQNDGSLYQAFWELSWGWRLDATRSHRPCPGR